MDNDLQGIAPLGTPEEGVRIALPIISRPNFPIAMGTELLKGGGCRSLSAHRLLIWNWSMMPH